ncbi:MAG: S8 family serine peptidase [Candidatus Sericytochromatia bacterium]|nr:S8 family serine peptidase [Candidatus Tanganyikabacteria bacterium]
MPTSKQRNKAIKLLAALSLAGCAKAPVGAIAPQTAPVPDLGAASAPRVRGSVLVRLRDGAGPQRTLKTLGVLRATGMPRVSVARTLPGESEETAAARLMKDPAVAYAEPNYIYRAIGTSGRTAADRVAEAAGRSAQSIRPGVRPRYMPNDPRLAELWGFQRIHATEAWDRTGGDSAVKVAVIDTGVDYRHEDLSDGRVIKGGNFADRTDDPMDDMGHGSHVAGTVGATADNARGVAGVAYKSTILAVKVLGKDGSGTVEGIAEGITKSVEMGARVINMSLGGPQSSQTLEEAVGAARKAGVIVVAAAGNDGNQDNTYPAAYPGVLAVGATDQQDSRARFSNYGPFVKIAAPGVDILSSAEGTYKVHSGTSMASPHVAGAIAVLVARKPDLTQEQATKLLQDSGEPTTGFATPGIRRINLARALDLLDGKTLEPLPEPPPQAPTPDPGYPGWPDPGQIFPWPMHDAAYEPYSSTGTR